MENISQEETTPNAGGKGGLTRGTLDTEVDIEPSERTLSETQPPDGCQPIVA